MVLCRNWIYFILAILQHISLVTRSRVILHIWDNCPIKMKLGHAIVSCLLGRLTHQYDVLPSSHQYDVLFRQNQYSHNNHFMQNSQEIILSENVRFTFTSVLGLQNSFGIYSSIRISGLVEVVSRPWTPWRGCLGFSFSPIPSSS